MSVKTRGQVMAREAYSRTSSRVEDTSWDEYATFAKRFPALIHTCGLAQAVVFARTKKSDYLDDLAAVLRACGHNSIGNADDLIKNSHDSPLSTYLRLSKDAIEAAEWLKRYVEAYKEVD